MTARLYKSTDVSAPVLSGTVGSLVALLDAILVTGYGAKPGAGWTKTFTGANAAVFRNSPAGGTGFYLQVDDNATNASLLARSARLRGFESMTSQTAGLGAFPLTAQLAAGIQVYKSFTGDATARAWVCVADQYTLTLLVNPGAESELNGWSSFHFGDFYSLKPGDAYRAIIIGRTVEGVPGAQDTSESFQEFAVLSAASAGHYVPRNYSGVNQSAITVGKHCGDLAKRLGVPYPNPADGGLMLAQMWLHEDVGNQSVIRGRLRGIWDFLHEPMVNVNDGDTFSGAGALAGKAFLMAKPLASNLAVIRCLVLETSDTWEAST